MSIHQRRTKKGVRYDVRLRDAAGEGYSRTFATRREAEAFQAREMADRSRGVWVDPRASSIKFADWATQWLDGDTAKRARSRYEEAGVIRLHLNPTLGDKPLASITPLDVRRLVVEWSQRAAPASVRRRYAVLRAIFASALEADVLGRSPCRGIKLPQLRPPDRPIASAADLANLAFAVGEDYKPLVYVAGVLGLRWGECAALRVGRIDFDRGTVTVAEAASEVAGEIVYGPPKSAAGRRTLAMPSALAEMLQRHIERRGIEGSPNAFVFEAPDGGPLRASNFRQRIWAKATQRAGLEGFRFHDLRHTAASTLVSAGVDIRTAQDRLGHSDPRLTLGVYAHSTKEADRRAADAIGSVLMPAEIDPAELQRARSAGRDQSRAMDVR